MADTRFLVICELAETVIFFVMLTVYVTLFRICLIINTNHLCSKEYTLKYLARQVSFSSLNHKISKELSGTKMCFPNSDIIKN